MPPPASQGASHDPGPSEGTGRSRRAPASSATSADLELPRVFGRFLLLQRLSRGGMGEIFLAKLGEIQGFEKLVIVKKILPNLVADEEFVKRFIDEAQVAIKLSHANIAPVIEVGRVDGEFFIALEYIEGRDVRKLMTRQRETETRMPVDLCLFLGREVANGLAYAHRKTDTEGRPLALVHCDISPPNLMVSFEGEVKVIDFGIAKSAIRLAGTNPNMGFGKFGYMAPEQLIKGGVVDRRTDIYAAGVVLYELLTGERVFKFPEGADYRQIARIVASGKIIPPSERAPGLDPDLDAIVLRALATMKEDRYQTGEEFRDSVQAKLSQLNPTISADSLAHYMQQLFLEELTEERKLVESMKAVDIAPFQEEFTQAQAQHTVTFARAAGFGLLGRRRTEQAPAVAVVTDEQLEAHPRRRAAFWAAAAGAMILGSAVALLAARSAPQLGRSTPPTVEVVQPPPAPAPVVAPPAPPPVEPTAPTAPPVASTTEPKQTRRPLRPAAPVVAKGTAPVSAESVQAKFRATKQEYSAFKAQYGDVLEERWNAIADEITFGKEDKFQRVDGMLDALRREMSKASR